MGQWRIEGNPAKYNPVNPLEKLPVRHAACLWVEAEETVARRFREGASMSRNYPPFRSLLCGLVLLAPAPLRAQDVLADATIRLAVASPVPDTVPAGAETHRLRFTLENAGRERSAFAVACVGLGAVECLTPTPPSPELDAGMGGVLEIDVRAPRPGHGLVVVRLLNPATGARARASLLFTVVAP